MPARSARLSDVSTYCFGLILTLGLSLGMTVTAAPLDEALKPLPPVPHLDAAKVELIKFIIKLESYKSEIFF